MTNQPPGPRRSIRLLGAPAVVVGGTVQPAPRGVKAWGLLAYLLLTDGPVPRTRLAGLLVPEADDPLAALRWNLAEARKALRLPDALRGDPVSLRPEEAGDVDAVLLLSGRPIDDDMLARVGDDLIEGIDGASSPAFDVWLDMQRRHVRGAAEALLHESALSSLASGRLREAVATAGRLVALNPYEEDFQSLLVRSLAASGDGVGAARQAAACRELFRRELGTEPGPALAAAARTVTRRPTAPPVGGAAAIRALVDAGNAAVGAGAVDAGLECLRRAAADAEAIDDDELRGRALCDLGTALVHAVRGRDEEGATALHEAVSRSTDDDVVVDACRELGFVEFMRGRYDRVDGWLRRAAAAAGDEPARRARLLAVRGASRSDVGRYGPALADLRRASEWSTRDRDRSYAESMVGRVHLLRGELDHARGALDSSIELARRSGWTGFLPWPQSLLGEVERREGDHGAARERLAEAFALGCQIGDPCWEGVSARGLGLVLADEGDPAGALVVLDDARRRCTRLPDGYLWLDAWILEAMCHVALGDHDPRAEQWVQELAEAASRRGMAELVVRAHLHGAELRGGIDHESLVALAQGVDNPALLALVAERA